MGSGALVTAGIGGLFFLLGVAQWYGPELHRLHVVLTTPPESGEKTERHVSSVVRAMAVAGMYIAGIFLAFAWTIPVFVRLYTIGATLLPK